MGQLAKTMPHMRPAELASAFRNITTSKGINVDKASVIRELPTEMVQHRKTSDDIIDELKREGIIISTAEEIDGQPPELPPAALVFGSRT